MAGCALEQPLCAGTRWRHHAIFAPMTDRFGFPQQDALPLIALAVAEDTGAAGDLSTLLTLPATHRAQARIVAKAPGVLAGLPIIPLVFAEVAARRGDGLPLPTVEWLRADGDAVAQGDLVCRMEGPVHILLTAERTLLNFIQQLSGAASVAAQYQAECAGTRCRILDTRKTVPGQRTLQKYAVRCGGASNHRMGLYDMIMLKDNHIAACGGVEAAVQRILQTRPAGVPIEVEVETLEQLQSMMQFPVERIMLDNMDVSTMAEAVRRVRAHGHGAELEASGNMTLARIAAVAATGVDFISVGALTHSVTALDLSMRFD